MEFTTHIDKEANLRINTVIGSITKERLFEKLNEIYLVPDFDPDMNVLWDLREADLSSFQSPDLQHLRDFVKNHWGTGGKSKAALVVSRDLDFGLSRMYEFFIEDKTSNDVHVFRNLDEALEWVSS